MSLCIQPLPCRLFSLPWYHLKFSEIGRLFKVFLRNARQKLLERCKNFKKGAESFLALMKTEKILGLTMLEPYGLDMHSHDSSACMVDSARVVGAVSEERFTRNKHHASFPWMSVNYLLSLDRK